jgi:hypothetical protein
MTTEFEKRVKMLKDLGVEYHLEQEYRPEEPPRSPHPIQVFRSVKPPFRPQEWCHLFMKDGQFYMGGCCGTMSQLQDELCHEIRMESGWFSIRKLGEIAETMIQHDGDEENDNEERLSFGHLPKDHTLEEMVVALKNGRKRVEKSKTLLLDPWLFLPALWHITKDFYGPEVPRAYGNHMTELEKSVSLLSRGLESISFERLFDTKPEEFKAPDSQTKANRAMLLYRMLPAWKTLNEKIGDLNLGAIDGYALIEKEKGPEAVCHNGHGYCIYESREKVEEILNLWRQQDKEYKVEKREAIDTRVSVRRVRVSAEKGLEFLGRLEPTKTPKPSHRRATAPKRSKGKRS